MHLLDPRLEVPFYKQTAPGYCHPTCIKMVVDYAIDSLGVAQQRLSLNKIARAVRAHPHTGTAIGDMELVNSLLLGSVPQIQFKSQVSGRLSDIVEEIDSRRPVIAWINISPNREDPDRLWHAVVIHGYDTDRNEIYFTDPEKRIGSQESVSTIGEFLDEKLGVEGRLTKLIISQIGQMDLSGRLRPFPKRRSSR